MAAGDGWLLSWCSERAVLPGSLLWCSEQASKQAGLAAVVERCDGGRASNQGRVGLGWLLSWRSS